MTPEELVVDLARPPVVTRWQVRLTPEALQQAREMAAVADVTLQAILLGAVCARIARDAPAAPPMPTDHCTPGTWPAQFGAKPASRRPVIRIHSAWLNEVVTPTMLRVRERHSRYVTSAVASLYAECMAGADPQRAKEAIHARIAHLRPARGARHNQQAAA